MPCNIHFSKWVYIFRTCIRKHRLYLKICYIKGLQFCTEFFMLDDTKYLEYQVCTNKTRYTVVSFWTQMLKLRYTCVLHHLRPMDEELTKRPLADVTKAAESQSWIWVLDCDLQWSFRTKKPFYPEVIKTNINPEQREGIGNYSWGVEFDGSNNGHRTERPFANSKANPSSSWWICSRRFIESSSILPRRMPLTSYSVLPRLLQADSWSSRCLWSSSVEHSLS